MKVCDKCMGKYYGSMGIQDQEFDLCHEHYQQVIELLTKQGDPPKRRGRPPKNSEQSE